MQLFHLLETYSSSQPRHSSSVHFPPSLHRFYRKRQPPSHISFEHSSHIRSFDDVNNSLSLPFDTEFDTHIQEHQFNEDFLDKHIVELVQFLILNDTTLNVRELMPLEEDLVLELLPSFASLCDQHHIHPRSLSIVLVIQVQPFFFLVTIGDDHFDVFSQTGYLFDFSQLPVTHSSNQPLMLWAFRHFSSHT